MVALRPSLSAFLTRATQGRELSARARREERVRADERRRLGADLHDHLGQHLTGLACLAAALREQLRREGSPFAAQAGELAEAANAAIAVARDTAHGLCPAPVARQGLRAALADLGHSVQRRHAISCTFEAEGAALGESPETAAQLYGIAQEAITNAIRHGRARRIAVRLGGAGGQQRLVIEDDGTGFDPTAPGASPGLGRRSMAQRAARIGGCLRIRPLLRGMRVECLFPSELYAHGAKA
jgi:signal transduction histidine kinase